MRLGKATGGDETPVMGSSVVMSLGFPATEDTGEGTRDVGGGGVRGSRRDSRGMRLLQVLLLESSAVGAH